MGSHLLSVQKPSWPTIKLADLPDVRCGLLNLVSIEFTDVLLKSSELTSSTLVS
jgi:hypothetical protein